MLTVNFNPFPIIETERLLLRQYSLNDAEDLFEIRKNPLSMKYIGKPTAKTINDAIELINLINTKIENNEGINWAITIKPDNKLVGMVSFHTIFKEHHRAQIGYMLHTSNWNKGIASEAAKAVIDYGFHKLNLHSIEALLDKDNAASIKLLTNLHFIKEAHFRENFYFNEVFLDTIVYSLLNK